jgi:hypothetical protein
MKIRIQGNSLRLRVTQMDVAQLCSSGLVESSIELSPGRPLRYVLQRSPDAAAVAAGFDGGVVHVSIPARVMAEWAGSDQVGIESKSQTVSSCLLKRIFSVCTGLPSVILTHTLAPPPALASWRLPSRGGDSTCL